MVIKALLKSCSYIGKMSKTGEKVFRQTLKNGNKVKNEYLLFNETTGNVRSIRRTVEGKRAGWVIDKPNGTSVSTTYMPQSISITKSGRDIDRVSTDIFISEDGKNVEKIYREFGWTRKLEDFKNGRIVEDGPKGFRVYDYLSPKKWTSLKNIRY